MFENWGLTVNNIFDTIKVIKWNYMMTVNDKWCFSNDIPENKWVYILYEICAESVETHTVCTPHVELFKQDEKSKGTLQTPSGALQFINESWNIIAWRYYE